MAKTRYTFKSGAPGAEPGLYKSCLNSERDISIRWWDGALWWDISSSRGSKSLPFKWPNGAAARGISMPARIKRYGEQDRLCLRKITNQAEVRWGTAYKHFEPDEVLSYLVGKGVLPKDWRESFQEEMRATRPYAETRYVEVVHKGRTLGAASTVVARVTYRPCWADEQFTNARLVAMSPTMFELLKEIVELAEKQGLNHKLYAEAKKVISEITKESQK